MVRSRFKIPILLQLTLAARLASFVRQRNYGYAFSRELANRTQQGGFRCERGF